jgi:glutamate---cysteine ligase / carboxylate-amine ligase
MARRERPSFTFGIEEEYFLVNSWTRALVSEPPRQMVDECKAVLGNGVGPEYQRSQIEIATKICTNMVEARAELARARNVVAALASRYGLAPIAASTHPFTSWTTQRHTDEDRYNKIADDLQALGRRMVIGGMHVHVGIEDKEQRIFVMNEIRGFLPLLLALSTSSPFWQGEVTGLMSYRTAINDATPRRGIPERFTSWNDYERTVAILVQSGVIEDATKIWWDVRPSARFSTLELRITDMCPFIEDALCIAALFRCLCRCLYRHSLKGERLSNHSLLLLNENRWRAQRYGLDQGFIDLRREKIVTGAHLVNDLLEQIREDAENFDCHGELEHVRVILARGTSANRQLTLYRRELARGLCPGHALRAVVDQLIIETAAGIGNKPDTRVRAVSPRFGALTSRSGQR